MKYYTPTTEPPLTLLCITRGDEAVHPFLYGHEELANTIGAECVIVSDGAEASKRVQAMTHLKRSPKALRLLRLDSQGYLESIHDEAVRLCNGRYIFRLDDDETVSDELRTWLIRYGYTKLPHWCFARQHLWGTPATRIDARRLWPDWQTRLSLKVMAGGRNTRVHAPSPYGLGDPAPGCIRHHKFLIRGRAEREALVEHYESIRPGAGKGKFLAFNVPELAFPDGVPTVPSEPIDVSAIPAVL